MQETIEIKGAGILYQEIILSALQEYRGLCRAQGNFTRGDVVYDIINKITFKPHDSHHAL